MSTNRTVIAYERNISKLKYFEVEIDLLDDKQNAFVMKITNSY